MPLFVTRDPEEFSRQATKFLESAVERNVLATVFRISRQRDAFGAGAPLYAYHLEADTGQLTAVALRTPPWPLLAAGFEDPDLAAELVHEWTQRDPQVPGVSAQPATAQAISTAWSRKTGGFAHRQFREAMHVLTRVIPPQPVVPGRLIPATETHREQLVEWEREFAIETGIGTGENAERMFEIRATDERQWVWEHDGRPVSTVGFNPEVAGTVRVGPVYTPPAERGRGYASAAVAATSQMLLDRGAQRCMLFTDLANPISNHVYARVGYERIAGGDWEQHGFHAADLPH